MPKILYGKGPNLDQLISRYSAVISAGGPLPAHHDGNGGVPPEVVAELVVSGQLEEGAPEVRPREEALPRSRYPRLNSYRKSSKFICN